MDNKPAATPAAGRRGAKAGRGAGRSGRGAGTTAVSPVAAGGRGAGRGSGSSRLGGAGRGTGAPRGRGRGTGRGSGRGAKASQAGAVGAGTAAASGAGAHDDDAIEPPVSFQGTFTKDLTTMMYGFGDSANPHKETVDLVEDIMLEYVSEMMVKAQEHTCRTLKRQVGYEDVLHLVRKDRRKYSRVRELLAMQQEIKDARKGMDDTAANLAELEETAGAGPAVGDEVLDGGDDVQME